MNILHYFLFTSLTKSNFRISSFMKVLYTFYLPAFEINLIAIRLDKKINQPRSYWVHCK
jgi:hypothetical protein